RATPQARAHDRRRPARRTVRYRRSARRHNPNGLAPLSPSRTPSLPSGDLLGVLLPRELVHRGILHDLLARDLPSFLDDPGERPVLPGGLLLDLLQHVLREVE